MRPTVLGICAFAALRDGGGVGVAVGADVGEAGACESLGASGNTPVL